MNKEIAILIGPQVAVIDYQPATALALMPDTNLHLVWKNTDPINGFPGIQPMQATTTFNDCPENLDLLLVPAILGLVDDSETLEFLKDRGSRARFVASVCGGSHLLAAAGLLQGYKVAGTEFDSKSLALCGANPMKDPVVEDGNRITSRGGSGAYEHIFLLIERLYSEDSAKQLRNVLEWYPQTVSASDYAEPGDLSALPTLQSMIPTMMKETNTALERAGRKLGL